MSDQGEYRAPGPFIRDLIDDMRLKRHRPVETRDDFEVHYIDLSPLKLRTSRFTPFLVPRRVPKTDSQLHDLVIKAVEFTRGVLDDFAVLLVGSQVDRKSLQHDVDFATAHLAIIDLPSIDAVRRAPDPDSKYTALGMELTRYLGTRSLSPYIRRKPAVAGRFFGRNSTIPKMLAAKRGANFTIVGNRRIGKTSLLSEIKDRLSSMYRPEAIRFGWLVGGLYDSTESVIRKILVEIGAPKEARDIELNPSRVRDFPSVLKAFAERENVTVAVFMDEIDRVLEFDELQNGELLWILKAAFEGVEHRIFLAGFRRAIQAYYNVDHPLYNFTQMEILRCLTFEETSEMVRIPLQRMGISLGETRLIDTIYRETGGHPELLQMVCKEIIEMYENSSSARVPSVDDLLAQLYEDEFEQAAHQTFLANTNVFEQVLCYLLIRDAIQKRISFEDYDFDSNTARDLLIRENIDIPASSVTNLIRNLEVSSIFRKVRGSPRWVFSVPQLARYCANTNIDSHLNDAMATARVTPLSQMIEWPSESDMNARRRASGGATA
jgi:hypothetical protein